MRTAAISALLLMSLTAGCGDSGGGSKDDEGTMDAGGGNTDNNGGPVSNTQEDDEDLDNACDYDPCCVGNEDYDFERCNGGGMKDAGTMDSSVPDGDDASVVEDAGTDAGADAAVDAGKTE